MTPRAALLLAVLATTGCGHEAPSEPPPPSAGAAASDLSRTDVVLTTKAPIREGRNVLWCATIQLAWDALADTVRKNGRLDLGPPAPPDVVAELNRRAFPHGDLDPASCVVLGGLGRDGISERIRAATRERFGAEVKGPQIAAGPLDAVGFGMLRKNLPFETPFRVHPTPISFAGGPARVHAFGMLHDDFSEGGKAMAKQVIRYLSFDWETRKQLVPGHADVIELLPRGGMDRIVLSQGTGKATLEDAWTATAEQMAKGRREPYERADQLEIPAIDLNETRRFDEFLGAPLAGVPGSAVKEVQQRIQFSLSERGATVASEAQIEMTMGSGGAVQFSSPFLLALIRREASRPYLLLWIANDDLLVKEAGAVHVPPEMAGSWILDAERSIAAGVEDRMTSERESQAARRRYEPEKVAAEEAPEKKRALYEAAARKEAIGVEMSMEIRPDGTCSLVFTRRGGEPGEDARTTTATGGLFEREGKVFFVPSTIKGSESSDGEGKPMGLELKDSALRILERNRVLFVLRRR